MTGSFIRACSIHNSFNRAINIQSTENVYIERNVIYDILGGGIVLEDGSEIGITLFNNLAVFVTGCITLTNDDLTPAAFSFANPNNSVLNNAVAGGSHHGYWYRLDYHSEGATYKKNSGKSYVPLRVFQGNSAHSLRGYGLYIYDKYFPMVPSYSNEVDKLVTFHNFISWNNKKGVAIGNIGNDVRFFNFTLIQNRLAGIEVNTVPMDIKRYHENSPFIQNCLIVGKTTVLPTRDHVCTLGGIILPLGRGATVKDVIFVNFNQKDCAAFRWTRIPYRCPFLCGGFTYYLQNMRYINAPNKAIYAWDWEGIISDGDGTSTKKYGNWTVLPTTGTLPSDCISAPEFSIGSPASLCPPKYKWLRFSFNNYRFNKFNNYIRQKNIIISNNYGTSTIPYAERRFTHSNGWMCNLFSNSSYKIQLENITGFNNVSFSGTFYNFQKDDYLYISTAVPELPDWFSVDGESINASPEPIKYDNSSFGDWNWQNLEKEIKFLVNTRYLTNGNTDLNIQDIPIHFRIYKCFYKDCKPPPDPNKNPPVKSSPLDFQYWHDQSIWKLELDGYMTNSAKYGDGVPKDFDNVKILPHTWVKVNLTDICRLRILLLHGVLEFVNSPKAFYTIEAEIIIIKSGRLIIGWPHEPFIGQASFILHDLSVQSPFNPGTGVSLGGKCIGVFGGLHLIGRSKGPSWTFLKNTAHSGTNFIALLERVQWEIGDEIVITSTAFGPWQTEVFKIISIGSDKLTFQLNATLKYNHIVHVETLPSRQNVTLRAGVGLLSRNIKVIGANVHKSHGARVIVGQYMEKDYTHIGYASLSNVEFYNTGEKGYPDLYDPHYSLTYLDVGEVNHIKPSALNNCSFHNSFATAVGIIGVKNITLINNIVYNSIGKGILSASVNTKIVHNLVIKTRETGIDATREVNLTLQNNLVTCSGFIGYQIPPLECKEAKQMYKNNRVYSNFQGALISPIYYKQSDCYNITGFIVWKNTGFGLSFNGKSNAIFEQNILIENQIGINATISRNQQISQVLFNVSVTIRNTTLVGMTSSFDCGDMIWVQSNRHFLSPETGMTGILFPEYSSDSGLTRIENVTFAKYGDSICTTNYAIRTNFGKNEYQRPVYSERIILFEVEHVNKIFFERIKRTVSYKCYSIDCDVLRLAVLNDLDGTFLGHHGAVIPKSDDDDIDYESKTPREMLTMVNGSRIPLNEIAPNKGIFRSNNCIYRLRWQAYECYDDITYVILLIKNMDKNAKYRQISPLGLLSGGFLDLLDVPLDKGHCSQHICRRKKTTFNILVATGNSYLLHFTRTTPKHLHFQLISANSNEGIKMTVWYSQPNRLDVYVSGKYMISTNARINERGRYIISMPQEDEFEPYIEDEVGTNHFERARGELTLIVKGQKEIEVVSQDTIIVSFGLPALTNAELFGANIVEYLAAFLDIPLTKIRVVNIVRETRRRRRKRSDTDTSIVIEIGDEPKAELNDTLNMHDSVSYSTLTELLSLIVNECQLGNISNILKSFVNCESIEISSDDSEIPSIEYSSQTANRLYFIDEPESEYEGVLLKTQPKIKALDIYGFNVTELGTFEYPWQLSVTIMSGTGHKLAILSGGLTVNSSRGWFNYTDLAISHSGQDYILEFTVVNPKQAENFSLQSAPFNVTGRPQKLYILNLTKSDIFASDQFDVSVGIADLNTDEEITDITWRGHTWKSEVEMIRPSVYSNFTGILNTSFDVETGRASFYNLSLTGNGHYFLKFKVVSDPPEYLLTYNWMVQIKEPSIVNLTIEETSMIQIKFEASFNDVLGTQDEVDAFVQTILTEYEHRYRNVSFVEGKTFEGSIIVELVISGSIENVEYMVYDLCEQISNRQNFIYDNHNLTFLPFLTVDNMMYYGVKCGDIPSSESKSFSTWIFIVAGTTLGLIILVIIVTCVICKCCLQSNTRIQILKSEHGMNKLVFTLNQHYKETHLSKDLKSSAASDADQKHHERELSDFSLNMAHY